jgi:photosystem II stability/assembly factor-like uncharacterized protein
MRTMIVLMITRYRPMRIVSRIVGACILWCSFGPVGYSQWSRLPGVPGGIVSALVIEGDTLYAGLTDTYYQEDGGVYRSTDLGATWRAIGLQGKSITCMAKNGPNLLVGTYRAGGLFRSSDAGQTWENPISNKDEIMGSLATYDSIVYAGGNSNRIYVSLNRGVSWWNANPPDTWGASCFTVAHPYLFAIQELHPRLIRSTIIPAGWTRHYSPADTANEPYPKQVFACGTRIFVPTKEGVFSSTDYGTTWGRSGTGLPSGMKAQDFCVVGDSVLAVAGGNIYWSGDLGLTWQLLAPVPYGADHAVFAASHKLLVVGTRGMGVLVSGDRGVTWNPPGIIRPGKASCLLSREGELLMGCNGGVYNSPNNGSSWVPSMVGMGNARISALSGNENSVFASALTGHILRSTDEGKNWVCSEYGGEFESVFALGARIFAGAQGCGNTGCAAYTLVSTNNGDNWVGVDSLTSYAVFASSDSVAFAGSSRYLFCGVRGCFGMWPDFGVYISQDGGATWKVTSYPIQRVSALAAQGSCIAAASTGFHISDDHGLSWRPIDSGISGDGRSLLWVGSQLLAATTSGVFRLKHGDSVWYPINEGLLDSSLTSLTIHGNNLFLVGSSGSVWRRPIEEIIMDVESEQLLPTHCSLSQNYPNPFNPTTTIGYVLQEKSNAKLTMLNSLGEEIAVLVNEEQDKGYHKVVFDASKLPSGVYFYQLKIYPANGGAGSFVETKKMILLR